MKLSSSDQFAVAFTSGAVSGMFAATITTPFDLAKTLMQVHELDTTSANSNRGAGSSLYNHGSTASASISSGTRNSSATSSTTTSGAAAVPRVIDVLRSIVQQDGWSGLFRGLSPRIVKVAPACAIMISTYELGTRRPWGV